MAASACQSPARLPRRGPTRSRWQTSITARLPADLAPRVVATWLTIVPHRTDCSDAPISAEGGACALPLILGGGATAPHILQFPHPPVGRLLSALVWLVAACAVLARAMPAPVAMSADAVG